MRIERARALDRVVTRARSVLTIGVFAALTACAEPPVPIVAAPERPVLPAAPVDFGMPVAVRPPRAGEDARIYAADERIGRLEANARLRNDAAFWRDVEARFGAPPP